MPDLLRRLCALESGRIGAGRPDYSALSGADVALLIRLYSRQPITDAERADAIRAEILIRNRDARPFAHLNDSELDERIAGHAEA